MRGDTASVVYRFKQVLCGRALRPAISFGGRISVRMREIFPFWAACAGKGRDLPIIVAFSDSGTVA